MQNGNRQLSICETLLQRVFCKSIIFGIAMKLKYYLISIKTQTYYTSKDSVLEICK